MTLADRPHRILVGRFGAPHGVHGDVRVQSFTQDPLAIGRYGPLTTDEGRRIIFVALRLLKDTMLVGRVEGIADRSAAARLTHLELFVGRAALPATEDDDEFYIADLVGLDAVDATGASFGTIVAVPNYGAGDLIEVRPASGGDTVLFPFTEAVVPVVDVAARRVVIVPPVEIEDERDA